MNRAIILAFTPLLALQGCTGEQLYNAIRDNRIQNCENLPVPQQDHCRSLYETTYEEYARDLEELQTEQRR